MTVKQTILFDLEPDLPEGLLEQHKRPEYGAVTLKGNCEKAIWGLRGYDIPDNIRPKQKKKAEVHFIYELRLVGENAPDWLKVFYVGQTNNPVARFIEHLSFPHSQALKAVIKKAHEVDCVIEMAVLCWSQTTLDDEERRLIYERVRQGCSLMNHEALEIPMLNLIQEKESAEIVDLNANHN